MNKYIKKIGSLYQKRGRTKKKLRLGKGGMKELIDLYVPADWRIKTTVITYKNNKL